MAAGGLGGGVAALKEAQFGLVKGLDPQAQAVNPQVPAERQLVGGDIVGVGFQGDFGVRGKSEMPPQIFHKLGKLRLAQPATACRPPERGNRRRETGPGRAGLRRPGR